MYICTWMYDNMCKSCTYSTTTKSTTGPIRNCCVTRILLMRHKKYRQPRKVKLGGWGPPVRNLDAPAERVPCHCR